MSTILGFLIYYLTYPTKTRRSAPVPMMMALCVLIQSHLLVATAAHQWNKNEDGAVTTVIEDKAGLLTARAVQKAAAEFNALPFISPILLVAPPENNRLSEISGTQLDGYNTIRMATSGQPAYTILHMRYDVLPPVVVEYDMVLDPVWVQTPEMLHLLLLHEFGHVMGLEHPKNPADTVMGYSVKVNEDGIVQQERVTLHLTKTDILNLYLHSIIFGRHENRFEKERQIQRIHKDKTTPLTLEEQRRTLYCVFN